MSIPYYVRIFRRATTASERRDIYTRAKRRYQIYIKRHDPWCLKCFDRPKLMGLVGGPTYADYCLSCYRTHRARAGRRERFSESIRKVHLPQHIRLCIDCGGQFESIRGNNLCVLCVRKAQDEVAKRCLGRTGETIRSEMVVNHLWEKFGNRYKTSLTPRIPLSTVGVFEAVR